MAGFFDNDVVTALRSAPEAAQDPTLALTAASVGGNVQQNAEVTAHVINSQATQNALDHQATKHGGHGIFGATLGWLGNGIGGALHTVGSGVEKIGALMNKPLAEVQHEYRYLRDVESRHGIGAMLGAAIPALAGGAIGTTLSGGTAGVLGAEAGMALSDLLNIGYADSWDRTGSDKYVDLHGGQAISPGRDAARAIGSLTKHFGLHIEQHKGFDLYDAVSAMGDGIFDLTLDPLVKVGALRHEALSAEGARGLLATRWGGTAVAGADIPRVVAQYPGVSKALEHIASISNPMEIAQKYPKFRGIATELAGADTWEKVGQVMVDKATAAEMTSRLLPRKTLGKTLFGPTTQALRQWSSEARLGPGNLVQGQTMGGVTAGLGEGRLAGKAQGLERRAAEAYQRVTTFVPVSFNATTNELSRTTFHFSDPNSANTIYEMARWGHTEGTARALATDYLMGSIQKKMEIYRNVQVQNIANRAEAIESGWTSSPQGSKMLANLGDRIDHVFMDIDAGRTTPWGFDSEGRIISKHTLKGETWSSPILEHQTINVPMPDYQAFDQNLKSLKRGTEIYGDIDDFLYRKFTHSVFKKWALASVGFALRVSSGELIPQVMRGSRDILEAKIGTSLAKRGFEVASGEEEHILAPIARFMARRTALRDDQLEMLAENVAIHDGQSIPSAVSAGHGQGQEIIGKEEYMKDSIYNLKTEVPKRTRMTDDVEAWGPEHDDHHVFWGKQAEDVGQSPAARAGAAAYRDAIGEGAGRNEALHRSSLAAKKVLDETPEDILNQNIRHFYSSVTDERMPGVVGTDVRRWVEGTPGVPAHWEAIPTPVGQFEVQRPLVNPRGNIPSGLREPGTLIEETGAPRGATVERHRLVEPEVPAGPATTQQVLGHEFGPQLLEEQRLQGLAPDPHLDWGRTIGQYLEGTVYGADGKLHEEVLNAIAEGRHPDMDYLEQVPMDSRPHKIMGAYEKPAAPDRLNDRIFNKLNGIINWMAREPIYNAELLRQWEDFKPLVDSGVLTREEALVRMNTRSVNNVLPHIHNINERTLMSEHARNWVPFYFAQQQSVARMFRLLGEDPAAFRKMQLTYTNLADFGGVYDDQSGNHQYVMPGLGFLTGKSMGIMSALGIPVINSIPTAFSGNLKSLASLSPFLEGSEVIRPGPLVALGARAIEGLLPEAMGLKDGFKKVATPIIGEQSADAPLWELIVPNTTMRNVVRAAVASDDRTQMKSVLDAIQALEYKQNVEMRKWVEKGKDPNDPDAPHFVPRATDTDMQRQQFIDRVKNHARILTLMKAVVGAVSPTAPSTQIGDIGLKDELHQLRESINPITGQPYGISGAITEFLLRHPDATPYAVFETDSGTSSPIESTHPAQQWVTQNMDFITDSRYSTAASYFVPQTLGKFDQGIYNEQMAMGLRHRKAPEQLIKDIHVSEGNRWYFDVFKPAKDAALAKARSPHQREVISKQWSSQGGRNANGELIQSLESMKLQNPLWYTNFSSGGRDVERQVAIDQMRGAIETGAAPDSPMTSKLQALLKDFDAHTAALLPGRTDQYAAAKRKQEKAQWQRYLQKTAANEPDLAMAVNNIFRGV